MTIILGIETSCDETAAAVIDSDKGLLSNIVFSQLKEHEEFGGVVPEIAARAHINYINGIIEKALKTAKITLDDLDAVCATGGPGLIGGVMIGLMSAKAISFAKKIPFIAVNHLQGHALMAKMGNDVNFPYLLMLTSGGHCQILIVKDNDDYELLGQTIDDSAGECFDKTAKIIGLGYPGGPKIEKQALNGDENRFEFPKPLTKQDNMDFSFSGLKTSVRMKVQELTDENNELKEQDVNDVCASLQKTIADIMVIKLSKAIKLYKQQHPDGKDLIVSGGVAANKYIRNALKELAEKNGLKFNAPDIKLCTDNGAMIAYAGLLKFEKGQFDSLDFAAKPRWPL
jgi:N6-L-threonylcarbamoyladenine synthase